MKPAFRQSSLIAALIFFVVIAPSIAALGQSPSGKRAEKRDEQPLQGLWPSEKLTRLVLQRIADDIADENELDEDQAEQLRDQMLKRWPKFLKENRKKIQPVVNEMLEMRLGMEPPSKEDVREFAGKAESVLNLVEKEINAGFDEARDILNPLQRAKFESKVLEFSAGVQVAKAKLDQWKRGEYTEREVWDPPRAQRRREWKERQRKAEEEARAAAVAAGETPPAPEPEPDQVDQELSRWEEYVEQMIKLYDFDDAQRNRARAHLEELSSRARAYRDRNRDRINRVEKRIESLRQMNESNQDTNEEMKTLKQQLVDVYGPIDDFFQELKRRIESIPTTAQRERFEQGETVKSD